jgi:hypothetical protein
MAAGPISSDEAAKQGAKGCLIIHNTEAASYPFKWYRTIGTHPAYVWTIAANRKNCAM